MDYALLGNTYPKHKFNYAEMFYLKTNFNLEIPYLESIPEQNCQCKNLFHDFLD
jgi:hypothetical protein